MLAVPIPVLTTRDFWIGLRAWANLLPHDESYEILLLLWSNTTLGLMLYWWCGVRQQMGRVSVKITCPRWTREN